MRWSYLSAFDITVDEGKVIVVKPLVQPYRYTEKTAKFLAGGYLHSTVNLKSHRSLRKFDLTAVKDFIPNVVYNLLIKELKAKLPGTEIYHDLVEVSTLIEKIIAGEVTIEQIYPEIKDLFSLTEQQSIEKLLREKNTEEKIGDKEVEEINRNLNAGSQILRLERIIIDNGDVNVFSSIFKNDNLKSIKITDIHFDERYCDNLLELLKLNKSLQKLSLTDVKLTNSIIIKLTEGLLTIKHPLSTLDLSDNFFDAADSKDIVRILIVLKNTKVRSLNLTETNFRNIDRQLAIDILNIPVDVFNNPEPFKLFFDDCEDIILQNNLTKHEGFFRFHFGEVEFDEQETEELQETKSASIADQPILQKRKTSGDEIQQEAKQEPFSTTLHYNYEGFLIANTNANKDKTEQNTAIENQKTKNLDDEADLPSLDSIQ